MRRIVLISMVGILPLAAQVFPPESRPFEFEFQKSSANRDNRDYQRGQSALDARRWADAVSAFSEVAAARGSRADAALYWKAYALNKLVRQAEALAALAQLRQAFPASRWLDDAKALEMEVRQASGQPANPAAQQDEELKLMALNSLMQSDPDRAIPLLEGILKGTQPPKVKDRALFVLAQSGSPKANQVLAQIAKGGANPDLQARALKYIAIMGKDRQILADVYASTQSEELKKNILHLYMIMGAKDRLLEAASNEKSPELRIEAIRQLGVSGGQNELWQLYQKEPSVEVKEKILQSMFVGNNAERLAEVARSEKDERLRKAAIRSLGIMGQKTGGTLESLYAAEKDPGIRREIVNGLFIQGNAHALVEMAKKETDPALKREMVQKLSLMHSKEATDYMMELLK